MADSTFDARKLPFIGPWIGRVGQVEQILSNPCSADPEIWVLAFWYNVPQLVWAVVKPDPVDYLTTRFGTVAGTKRKRRFRAKGMIPSVDLQKFSRAWAVFKIIGIKERIGFYFLIVDATTEFAVNWTSTAYQWAGCPNPTTPWCEAQGVSAVQGGGGTTGTLFNSWGETGANIWAADSNSIQTTPGFQQTVFVNIVSKPPPAGEWCGPVSWELIDTDSLRVLQTGEPQKDNLNQWVARGAYSDWLSHGVARNWAVRLRSAGDGFFDGRDSTFKVYGSGNNGVQPDP